MQGSQNPHALEDGHLRDGTGPSEPEGVEQQRPIQQHLEGSAVGEDACRRQQGFWHQHRQGAVQELLQADMRTG